MHKQSSILTQRLSLYDSEKILHDSYIFQVVKFYCETVKLVPFLKLRMQ